MQDQAVRLRNEVAGRNRKSIKRINCSFRLGLGSLFMFKSCRKSIVPDSSDHTGGGPNRIGRGGTDRG